MNRLAAINDRFRQKVIGSPREVHGKAIMTQGFAALNFDTQMQILARVRGFDTFTTDNDPYGEHDFGTIEGAGLPRCFWKIEYYADANMDTGAEDADLETAYRVLVVMLADDY